MSEQTYDTESIPSHHDESSFNNLVSDLSEADKTLEPDYDPKAAEQAEADEKAKVKADVEAKKQAMEATALIGISSFEQIMQSFAHSEFKLEDSVKEQAVKAYAPVLEKYSPQGLAFMDKYGAEIMALMFTAQLSRQSIAQVKQLKIEDKRKAEAKKTEQKKKAEPVTVPMPKAEAEV